MHVHNTESCNKWQGFAMRISVRVTLLSLVPSLSARQIFIAYSIKNILKKKIKKNQKKKSIFHTVSDKNLTRGKAG